MHHAPKGANKQTTQHSRREWRAIDTDKTEAMHPHAHTAASNASLMLHWCCTKAFIYAGFDELQTQPSINRHTSIQPGHLQPQTIRFHALKPSLLTAVRARLTAPIRHPPASAASSLAASESLPTIHRHAVRRTSEGRWVGKQNSRVANQEGGGGQGAEKTEAGMEAPRHTRARRRDDRRTERNGGRRSTTEAVRRLTSERGEAATSAWCRCAATSADPWPPCAPHCATERTAARDALWRSRSGDGDGSSRSWYRLRLMLYSNISHLRLRTAALPRKLVSCTQLSFPKRSL